jgi:regulator of protease activity HflC (stomatin/prohibitin superfamily)
MRKFVLPLAALAATFMIGCTTVDTGTVGVKTRFGKVVSDDLEPGLHGINPFTDRVREMSTQTIAYVVTSTAVSQDMQVVTTQVTVNYAMAAEFAGEVYTKYRREFEDRVMAPTVQEAVKTATAQFDVEDLVSQREKVKTYVFETLSARVAPTHLVEAVMLTDFAFSPEFTEAIEAKVTATQQALEEKNKLEATKYQAEQRIVQARGEAEAIRIQAQAITGAGGNEYVQLQWIQAWRAGGSRVPQVTGAGNSMYMLNLDNKENK